MEHEHIIRLNDMEREPKMTMVSMKNKHIIHLNDMEISVETKIG